MEQKFVTYEAFGAVGDGKADDMGAICAAHEYANREGLPVKATPGAVYYIGGKDLTAVIKTNTDWNTATFILDDRAVENRGQAIFRIPALYETEEISLSSLEEGQSQFPISLGYDAIVNVKDDTRHNYIRMGVNSDQGRAVSDAFVVSQSGEILNRIMWDYPTLTLATAKRIEDTPLVVSGGFFKTIANEMPSFYTYFDRNIQITRSRVTVKGVTHRVEGEGEHGAPYGGFIAVHSCAYFTLENCSLTGHKTFYTQGHGGMTPMGTYDINLHGCLFCTLRGVTQVPSIMDSTRWGLMGSNFCKNITLENCEMSRFDAHAGVTDSCVKGSKLGWQCVHAIGKGNFTILDSEIFGYSMVTLRYDYGGHWDGKLEIRNSVWHPTGDHPSVVVGHNPGTHDFGYVCKMPETVIIENLRIADEQANCQSYAMLSSYCDRPHTDLPFPYVPTKNLIYKGVKRDSGGEIVICRDPLLYPDLKTVCED